jgi:hypothetical protein
LDFVLGAAGEGELALAWPEFVQALWNDDPIPAGHTFRDLDPTWLTTWREARDNCPPHPQGSCTPDSDLSTLAPDLIRTPVVVTLPNEAAAGRPAIDLSVPELSAKYHRFQFDPSIRQVTVFNGYSQLLARKVIVHRSPIGPTPHTIEQNVEHYVSYDATPSQVAGRNLYALEKIAGQWKLVDLTSRPFFSLCLDRASERVEELVLLFSNANFTAARASGFEAGAAGPVGSEPTTLLASAAPCYEYQGHYATQVAYSDVKDHFNISTSFEATYEAQPETLPFTDVKGSGTAFIGWRYTAKPASIRFASTVDGTLTSCGFNYPLVGNQSYGSAFFAETPGIDVIVSTPLDLAFNGYEGQSLGLQWTATACGAIDKRLPATNSTDFKLSETNWLKLDVSNGRLISGDDRSGAASSAPVYDAGDYPTVQNADYTWCFAALRQDAQGKDEPAPAVCE